MELNNEWMVIIFNIFSIVLDTNAKRALCVADPRQESRLLQPGQKGKEEKRIRCSRALSKTVYIHF